jgi:hypothetical protein
MGDSLESRNLDFPEGSLFGTPTLNVCITVDIPGIPEILTFRAEEETIVYNTDTPLGDLYVLS